jgi:hypothetical protein
MLATNTAAAPVTLSRFLRSDISISISERNIEISWSLRVLGILVTIFGCKPLYCHTYAPHRQILPKAW